MILETRTLCIKFPFKEQDTFTTNISFENAKISMVIDENLCQLSALYSSQIIVLEKLLLLCSRRHSRHFYDFFFTFRLKGCKLS